VTALAADYDARWGYRQLDARRYEARRYGSRIRRLNLHLLERAVARAFDGVAPGSLILDVPCGTGVLSAFLAARGLHVVGADISPAMLEVARERVPDVARIDLEQPPWRRRSFAGVLCARFLMHLPAESRPRVLRTLAELTHGPLVATVCHPYTVKSFGRAVRRQLGGRPKRSVRLTRAELAAEVSAAGLVLRRVIPVMPVLSEVWVVVIGNP
jgi:2-polyprenyl-3-methyl-5-hydroxy-6-metoxy-1,4-benzoquinol methylase